MNAESGESLEIGLQMPEEVWGLWVRKFNTWLPAREVNGGKIWFRSRQMAELYAAEVHEMYQFDARPVRLDEPPRVGIFRRLWGWKKARPEAGGQRREVGRRKDEG